MCIFKAGLSSLSDDWTKHQEKVSDALDSNKNVETTCNSKLKFMERKNLFIKRARSLLVSDLRSETKGSRFESGCWLYAEVSSLQ